MTRLRTALVAVGLGVAVIATGAAVANSAMATPAAVSAVGQLGADPANVAAGTTTGTIGQGATDARYPRTAARRWWNTLTEEQRTCLTDAKINRPVGPLDDAERAALRAKVEAAAGTCQVTLPFSKARALWNDLTDEQRTCLKDAAVTRPWGPLTKEQRQQVRTDLRTAAHTCGVTWPTKSATP